MRTNLKVPFAEKDEAKKLGARWDAARKIWYVEDKLDMAPFSRWSPTPQQTDGDGPVASGTVAHRQQATGIGDGTIPDEFESDDIVGIEQ